jgi:hypothetical protein
VKPCPFCAEQIDDAAVRCPHCGSDLPTQSFAPRVISFTPTKKGAEVDFVGGSREDVANIVERFFFARKFKLEGGDKYSGTYGIGNAVARALAGGLVKRAKYSVQVVDSGMPGSASTVRLILASEMSGMSGSLLGVQRENKQRKEFVDALQSYLGASAPPTSSPAP